MHNKVAEITLAFWVMKICATTLGETAGDLLSITLDVGYAISTLILLGCFAITLFIQLRMQSFHAYIYWLVILSTSTAGTTMSDFMDRTLGLGYATGSLILVVLLIVALASWYVLIGNLSVSHIADLKTELLYWLTILISNTLGTALGDYLADDSGLGFMGGALLIGSAIAYTSILYRFTPVNRVALFWAAFVLTRPFGATFGDLLTKPLVDGGLGFGTAGSSAVLLAMLAMLVIYGHSKNKKATAQLKI
jgi:uncharacterized membrane-anchored protein